MTLFQDRDDIVPAKVSCLHQYRHMIEKIGHLLGAACGIAADGGQRDLDAFLPDLLPNPLRSGVQQLARVARGVSRSRPVGNDNGQVGEPSRTVEVCGEATRRAEMANGAFRFGKEGP